jgi:hypothetical protein
MAARIDITLHAPLRVKFSIPPSFFNLQLQRRPQAKISMKDVDLGNLNNVEQLRAKCGVVGWNM